MIYFLEACEQESGPDFCERGVRTMRPLLVISLILWNSPCISIMMMCLGLEST